MRVIIGVIAAIWLVGCTESPDKAKEIETKMVFKTYKDAYRAASQGIVRNKIEDVVTAFTEYPELKNENDRSFPWIIDAVGYGNREMVERLLAFGCDVNETSNRGCTSAITVAISRHPELLPLLLSHGGDPNLPDAGAILTAINESGLEAVKLLVEHGADVNQVFDLYGNKDELFTALEFAKSHPDIVAYLRSKGAKTVDELRAEGKLPLAGDHSGEAANPVLSFSEQTVQWFDANIGPVQPAALTEIVPSDVPITIHVIPPSDDRPFVTLFTTGMYQSSNERARRRRIV